jgi:hypothetical protein
MDGINSRMQKSQKKKKNPQWIWRQNNKKHLIWISKNKQNPQNEQSLRDQCGYNQRLNIHVIRILGQKKKCGRVLKKY